MAVNTRDDTGRDVFTGFIQRVGRSPEQRNETKYLIISTKPLFGEIILFLTLLWISSCVAEKTEKTLLPTFR
jgi:hypothetical protein